MRLRNQHPTVARRSEQSGNGYQTPAILDISISVAIASAVQTIVAA